jgi:hypothetical protein
MTSAMPNDKVMPFNADIKVVRQYQMAEKVVIVDGQPGCGKTMLSPIIASLNRVELLSYAFEIEFICRLLYLNKIDNDAAVAMVKMLIDHKLYQTMMSRDVNFRYSDLSSVFKDVNPWRYFKRLFQNGDMVIPEKIERERPILNLTTHDLLGMSDPLTAGLGNAILFIEVVRHPLYMITQQTLNMERLVNSPRDIQVYIEYNGQQLPYFAQGWEEKFVKANPMEKAIYAMQRMMEITKKKREHLKEESPESIITIPFEKFVIKPEPFMADIQVKLDTTVGKKTHKVLRKQNVPREILADGPNLAIYKRCGWVPATGENEEVELDSRRKKVSDEVSKEALVVMDGLCEDYVQSYLST